MGTHGACRAGDGSGSAQLGSGADASTFPQPRFTVRGAFRCRNKILLPRLGSPTPSPTGVGSGSSKSSMTFSRSAWPWSPIPRFRDTAHERGTIPVAAGRPRDLGLQEDYNHQRIPASGTYRLPSSRRRSGRKCAPHDPRTQLLQTLEMRRR